jgi:hypothetical protein
MKNKYTIGNLVTLKTHPLLYDFRIKGDSKFVPPIMMVKEVFIENKKKRTHDEETGKQVSDRIKYVCVHFDDNNSQFIESTIYQSFLSSFEALKIERISEIGEISDDSETIIEEIKNYFETPLAYAYGKKVSFITKKIEIYKKRSSKKITEKNGKIIKEDIKSAIQYVVNYATPDFLMCGFKKNEVKNLFYEGGSIKKQVAEKLLKVKWFNPTHQKFSDEYLPIEFFTDKMGSK